MKCPHCFALCSAGDALCFACKSPIAPATAGQLSLAQRLGTACSFFGGAGGGITLPADFPTPAAGGLNLGRCLCIAVVCAVFGSFGTGLGVLISRSRGRAA